MRNRKKQKDYINPLVQKFIVHKDTLAKDHCLEHINEMKDMLEDKHVLRVTSEESKSIISKIEGAWDELRQLCIKQSKII